MAGQTGSQAQQFMRQGLIVIVQMPITLWREQALQTHAVFGQRAGFVKHHRVHLRQTLQGLDIAQQHALSRQLPGSRQHGGRCGQGQSAWTGDDEHRHRHHQRMAW